MIEKIYKLVLNLIGTYGLYAISMCNCNKGGKKVSIVRMAQKRLQDLKAITHLVREMRKGILEELFLS